MVKMYRLLRFVFVWFTYRYCEAWYFYVDLSVNCFPFR
jgi:hypothetical protein